MQDFYQARRSYANLTGLYPNFAVAYSQQGILFLQLYAYVKTNGTLNCGPGPAFPEEIDALYESLPQLESQTEMSFREALVRDPSIADAWFQLGTLLFQMQDPSLLQSTVRTSLERRRLLDQAVGHYRIARKLRKDDAYIWFLLGRALGERSRTGGVLAARDRWEAESVLCRSSGIAGPGNRIRDDAIYQLKRLGDPRPSCA